MRIKKIKVSNFKSFDNINLELEKLSVVIGPNAAGKSNFVNLFKFIKDIVDSGLDDAISMQGGPDYLTNITLGTSKNLSVSLDLLSDEYSAFYRKKKGKGFTGIFIREAKYEFTIEFPKTNEYRVIEEKLKIICDFARFTSPESKPKEKDIIGRNAEFTFTNAHGKFATHLNKYAQKIIGKDSIFLGRNMNRLFSKDICSKHLLIERPLPLFFQISDFFSDISIYDFDPKKLKGTTQITGKTELEPDGSNLALILKHIRDDSNKWRKFSNLIQDILPFVRHISIEKQQDRSLITNLEEVYSKKPLPAVLISDGTIDITALIVALYFETKPLIIIEEPERNIHPYLISKIMDMVNEVSAKKQIIITTHDPEVLKNIDSQNVFIVCRADDGFSKISKPSERNDLKNFLNNNIGIAELHTQNLL